jgi:hypothetical protein
MRHVMSALLCSAALAAAVPAAAQGTGSSSTQKPSSSSKKPVPKLPIGYRAFFIMDAEFMTASDSFTAVTGSPTVFGFGGGGEVLNVWRKLFIRTAFAASSTDGERVFVEDDGTVIPIGLTNEITMQTLELGAGWRTYLKKHPKVAWYYGGGLLFVKYNEQGEFGTVGEEYDDRFLGYSVQGGFDFALWKYVTAAVEGQYRIVNAPATGGASLAFDENSLGGFAIRGMIGVRFKK